MGPDPEPESQPDQPKWKTQSDGASSPGSSAAGNPFLGNRGPGFDPEAQPAPPEPTPLQLAEVRWEADRIHTILKTQGTLTHNLIGRGTREAWLWRPDELAAIDEPLANVLNKMPVTRAAAAVSDELAAGAILIGYGIRSTQETLDARRNAALAAEQAAEARTPGRAPEVPTGGYAPDFADQPTPEIPAVDTSGVQWRTPE